MYKDVSVRRKFGDVHVCNVGATVVVEVRHRICPCVCLRVDHIRGCTEIAFAIAQKSGELAILRYARLIKPARIEDEDIGLAVSIQVRIDLEGIHRQRDGIGLGSALAVSLVNIVISAVESQGHIGIAVSIQVEGHDSAGRVPLGQSA